MRDERFDLIGQGVRLQDEFGQLAMKAMDINLALGSFYLKPITVLGQMNDYLLRFFNVTQEVYNTYAAANGYPTLTVAPQLEEHGD